MLERISKPANMARRDTSRLEFLRRSRVEFIVLGAILVSLVHASSGHQINQETITSKVVVAESLMLEPSGDKTAVILGTDPARQTSLSFINAAKSSHLNFGIFGNQMPAMWLYRDVSKTRKIVSLGLLPTGASVRIGDRHAGGELAIDVFNDGLPRATFSDAGGGRMLLSGAGKRASRLGSVSIMPRETGSRTSIRPIKSVTSHCLINNDT